MRSIIHRIDPEPPMARLCWTAAEEGYLRRNHGRPLADMAAFLGRSPCAVATRLRMMGLAEAHQPWTPEDEAYLRQHHAAMTSKALAQALGRSVSAIKTRAHLLGLRSKHRPWTPDELARLRLLWPVYGRACAAQFPGRSPDSVAEVARRLRLGRVMEAA